MRVEKATYALLVGGSGITALVGTRIYPRRLPQNHTLPALVYSLISAPRELNHSGAESLVTARVQVTAHASTYAVAKSVQNAVQSRADGYSGTVGGVVVDKVYTEDGPDGYDPTTETEQAVTDLLISYQET